MIGLSQKEFEALAKPEREALLVMARAELEKAGAHYVVDSLAEVDPVLDDIDARLRNGENP
jgi:phosphonoacetaldehyde hydrolase